MSDTVAFRDVPGRFELAPHQGYDVDSAHRLDRIEMFDAKCTGTGQNELHTEFSRIR